MIIRFFTTRRVAWVVAALGLLLLALRIAALQGLLSVVRIEGASMAEALPGAHTELACPRCEFTWRCDLAAVEQGTWQACPNCGRVVDSANSTMQHAGARVVIDRAAFWLRSPQRFDVVAFQVPGSSPELAVKRIVALPGEEWKIQSGDLWIDGQRVRKPYSLARELATLVSRDHPRARNRWEGTPDTAWQRTETTWSWSSAATPTKPEALIYHHFAKHPAAQHVPSPVQDDDGYNPSSARALNEVVDLLGECEMELHGATITFVVHDGYDSLRVELHSATGKLLALRGELELSRHNLPSLAGTRKIVWGVIDRQLFFACDELLLLREVLPEIKERPTPSVTPLEIRTVGEGSVSIHNLAVWRDVYYLPLTGNIEARETESQQPLGEAEFALLGDNPAISLDSRHWLHSISREALIGRVLRLEKL